MGEGSEAGALEGAAGGEVGGAAAWGGDGAEGVALLLELLDEVGAEALLAERLAEF